MAPITIEREDLTGGLRRTGRPEDPEPLVSVTYASGRVDRFLGEPPDDRGQVPRFERTRELPDDALVDLHGLAWSAEHARALTRRADRILIDDGDDPFVPRWALDPPPARRPGRWWTQRSGGFTLSPRLAHRYLALYVRADDALLREIAHTLARLKGIDGWRALGVARLEDYARERLGCSRRWAQELMRLHETLDACPALRDAHASGRLSTAKVLALAPLAKAVREGVDGVFVREEVLHQWIARGERASVRVLRQVHWTEVAQADWEAECEEKELEEAAQRARDDDDVEGSLRGEATNDAGAHDPLAADTTPPLSPEREEGEWVQLRAPAAVTLLHELALDIARAMDPSDDRAGACVERILAEHLAAHGLPEGDPPAPREPDPENEGWRLSHDDPFEPYDDHDFLPPETVTERVALIASLLAAHVPPRPEDLDRHLRRLVRARQRRRAEMQGLLYFVKRYWLWQRLGYGSFRAYCERALGIPQRTAQEMVSRAAALRDLPILSDAFASGAVTSAQLTLLVRVATPDTEGIWLDRASAVTVRYLAREVAEAEHRAQVTDEPALPQPLSTAPPYGAGSPVRPGAALVEMLRAVAGDGGGAGGADDGTARGRRRGDDVTTDADTRTCAHDDEHDDAIRGAATRATLPDTRWTIRFWLPRDVHDLWRRVDHDLATALPGASAPWQRYLVLLAGAIDEWCRQSDEACTRTAAYAIHEREGFMCAVPGCTERGRLEGHHVAPRAHGGSDDPQNLVSICPLHHHLGVHGAWQVAVSGEGPDELLWTLGIGTFRGDVRIG